MNYEALEPKVKTSFGRAVTTVIGEAAKDYELSGLSSPLDYEFLEMLSFMLEEEATCSTAIWTEVAIDISTEEFDSLVMQKLTSLGAKTPTTKQIDYFRNLSLQLGKDPTVPDNYLQFTYELSQLQQLYVRKGPAKKQAIKKLKKDWLEETGEKLELPKNVTSEEISHYYELLEDLPFKPIKNVTIQLLKNDTPLNDYLETSDLRTRGLKIDLYQILIHFDTDTASYEAMYASPAPSNVEWECYYVAHSKSGHCSYCGQEYISTGEEDDDDTVCQELDFYEEGPQPLLKYLYKNFREKFLEYDITLPDIKKYNGEL